MNSEKVVSVIYFSGMTILIVLLIARFAFDITNPYTDELVLIEGKIIDIKQISVDELMDFKYEVIVVWDGEYNNYVLVESGKFETRKFVSVKYLDAKDSFMSVGTKMIISKSEITETEEELQ